MADDVKAKVIDIMSSAKPLRAPRKKRAAAAQSVVGDNNIQAGRDVHITTERVVRREKVVVTPGYNCITEVQKVRLTELKNEWVALSKLVQRPPISYAAAQSAINKRGGTTSIHRIPLERFAEVETWVLQQIARLNSTPTARRRSQSWRTARISAIQARCHQLDCQDWRKTYMQRNFGASSMTQLGDDDLETLYRAVMNRR